MNNEYLKVDKIIIHVRYYIFMLFEGYTICMLCIIYVVFIMVYKITNHLQITTDYIKVGLRGIYHT